MSQDHGFSNSNPELQFLRGINRFIEVKAKDRGQGCGLVVQCILSTVKAGVFDSQHQEQGWGGSGVTIGRIAAVTPRA